MNLNIVSLLTNSLDDLFINNSATSTNEQPSTIKKLITGIVPSLLLSLINRKQNLGGQALKDLFGMSNLFNTNQQSSVNESNIIKNAVWGNDNSSLLRELANFADVTPATAGQVVDAATPRLLNSLSNNQPSNMGVMDWLMAQKDNILAAIPSGLNLGSALGIGSLASLFSGFGNNNATAHTTAHPTADRTYDSVPEPNKSGNGIKWILLLAIAGLLAWWLFGKGCNDKADKNAPVKKEVANTTPTPAPTNTTPQNRIDADGNYIYEVGENTEIALADGSKMTVGNNSTEFKLFNFLTSGTIDENDKTKNWITCDRVYFKTGGSELTATSTTQVENIARILKNFPNASIKLGGYTDNTGDAAVNKKLSAARAKIVADKLLSLGVSKAQIDEAEGYGPEHPIASNDTEEGKAQNRRVDLKVAKK